MSGRARRDAALMFTIALLAALAGQPRPLALGVALVATLTAAYVLIRDLEQGTHR
jgi:hypothetical protein